MNQKKEEILFAIDNLIEASEPAKSLFKVVELLKQSNPLYNWVGIYILSNEVLKLGPYIGQPTEHTTIEIGHGVCGTAVKECENQIIDDVRELDNYIACTLETRAEIVVLIKDGEQILGQFDIDSDTVNAFSKDDEALLMAAAEKVAPLIKDHSCSLID